MLPLAVIAGVHGQCRPGLGSIQVGIPFAWDKWGTTDETGQSLFHAVMLGFQQRTGEIVDNTQLIILIVVLVLLFGGGGGYYWSRRGR